jgi:site-specific DNA recombinase
MLQAIAYTRVSTVDQARHNLSLQGQESAIRKWANDNDVNIVEIFTDAGESAKTADRTNLKRAMEYAASHKKELDVFVVYKLDRFARNTEDHTRMQAALLRMGIRLKSTTENIDESASGKLMSNLFSMIHQFDNDNRAERTVEGLERRRAQGGWTHKAPLGYVNRKTLDGIPSLIEDKDGPLVSRLLKEYMNGQYNFKEMQDLANKIGLRARSGAPIAFQSMRDMLSNPVYGGFIRQKNGRLVMGVHKGLISPTEFLTIQRKIEGRGRSYAPTIPEDWSLRGGFVTCSTCGKPLTSSTPKGRGGKRYELYSCTVCRKSVVGHAVSIKKDDLHSEFQSLLQRLQLSEEAAKEIRTSYLKRYSRELKKDSDKREIVRKELEDLKNRKIKAINMLIDGTLSNEDREMFMENIDSEITQKQIELEQASIEELGSQQVVDLGVQVMSNLSLVWKAADSNMKRVIQNSVFPEGVTYDFENGFRTPILSDSYLLITKKASEDANNSVVVPRTGLEPVRHC